MQRLKKILAVALCCVVLCFDAGSSYVYAADVSPAYSRGRLAWDGVPDRSAGSLCRSGGRNLFGGVGIYLEWGRDLLCERHRDLHGCGGRYSSCQSKRGYCD